MGVFDFGDAKAVAAFDAILPAFDCDFAVDRDGLFVLDVESGGDGALVVEFRKLAHGFVENNGYLGRPVDFLVMKDGSLLVSDDHAGAIYRISYGK